jgi:hypothetical protein
LQTQSFAATNAPVAKLANAIDLGSIGEKSLSGFEARREHWPHSNHFIEEGKSMSAVQPQNPYCVAMILSEGIYRCGITGKFTILGTFTRFRSQQLPAPAQFAVYFAVTDGIGAAQFTFKIFDSRAGIDDDLSEEEATLFSMPINVTFPDSLAVIEGVLGVSLEFPRDGQYICELVNPDGSTLMSRRLVVDAPPPAAE